MHDLKKMSFSNLSLLGFKADVTIKNPKATKKQKEQAKKLHEAIYKEIERRERRIDA